MKQTEDKQDNMTRNMEQTNKSNKSTWDINVQDQRHAGDIKQTKRKQRETM